MSQGATFKLIANDGKADRMIMATKLLNQRIKDVMCARRKAGLADITPTLVDLERTHILFMNAHYKPYAAIGYEYNKVRPQSGNPTLANSVTFSIPQYGDFFHDMVARTRLGPCMGEQGSTPDRGTLAFPADDEEANLFYSIVDCCGNVLVSGEDEPIQYRNFVRYCEYPGNRLFQLTKFDVNGNPLDQYDYLVPVMLEKFCTPPNKRVGHDRLVGQEVPLTGYSGLCCAVVSDADADNTPAGISRGGASNGASAGGTDQSNQTVALFNENAAPIGSVPPLTTVVGQTSLAPLNAVGGPQIDLSRQLKQIVNGPQTPKPVQAALEVWNKLRFWFNDDVRLSIPSVSIPFGQRYITIDLCRQDELVFEYPSIFLETGFDDGVNRRKTYTPIFQKLGVTQIDVSRLELYINNIFVNPEIHDIYIQRIGFSLIRVYRQHTQRSTQEGNDEKLLSQLKWPIEYMFGGLRPVWNIRDVTVGAGGLVTGGNQNKWRDWHRMTRLVDATCDEPMLAEAPIPAPPPPPPGLRDAEDDGQAERGARGRARAGQRALVGPIPLSTSSIGQVIPDQYWLPVPTVNSLTLTAHGITIYDNFADMMYNQYLPYHYGGPALVTPDDPGALFINMSLFPRSYQPSGHLNVSRARETYISWTTSYVSAATPADLIIVGVAINFLLVTDGSAVLRYST